MERHSKYLGVPMVGVVLRRRSLTIWLIDRKITLMSRKVSVTQVRGPIHTYLFGGCFVFQPIWCNVFMACLANCGGGVSFVPLRHVGVSDFVVQTFSTKTSLPNRLGIYTLIQILWRVRFSKASIS